MKRSQLFLIALGLVVSLCACSSTTNLETKKRMATASKDIGEAYMMQGNFTEALKELLEAEKLYADDHILQHDLGLAYMQKKELPLAIKHFKKAIRLKPGYAAARNSLGTAYLADQKWDQAIALFEELTKDLLYATPHYPLSNLGYAYYNKQDYRQAESYYLKALELEPKFTTAMVGLARTYLASQRTPAALTLLENAVKQNPRSAALFFELGQAYKLSGRYAEAAAAFERTVTLDPNGPLGTQAQVEAKKLR